MAIDECLLESAAQGLTTLRFYRWLEPTLSLGYFQSAADRAQSPLLAELAWVRRASGGGAILHHHELTYSYAAPLPSGFRSEELYRHFHQTLRETLAELGAEAEFHGPEQSRGAQPLEDKPFLCFQRRSEFDLVIGQHKVVGSAQRKARKALIQHGSILLAASPMTPQLLGANELSHGGKIEEERLTESWTKRLAERLEIRLRPGGLSDSERSRAEEIAAEKFASPEWLHKR